MKIVEKRKPIDVINATTSHHAMVMAVAMVNKVGLVMATVMAIIMVTDVDEAVAVAVLLNLMLDGWVLA